MGRENARNKVAIPRHHDLTYSNPAYGAGSLLVFWRPPGFWDDRRAYTVLTRGFRLDRAAAQALQVQHHVGSSHHRHVIDGMRAHPSPHPLGHESLIFVDDHAVLLCHEEPSWLFLPERPTDGNGDACRRDRSLNRREDGQIRKWFGTGNNAN